MKTLEIKVDADGVLKVPHGSMLPSHSRLAVLLFEPSEVQSDDLNSTSIANLAAKSGAFNFLKDEPEIYSDADILPGRVNPRFRK